jgi:hypothetical protein
MALTENEKNMMTANRIAISTLRQRHFEEYRIIQNEERAKLGLGPVGTSGRGAGLQPLREAAAALYGVDASVFADLTGKALRGMIEAKTPKPHAD